MGKKMNAKFIKKCSSFGLNSNIVIDLMYKIKKIRRPIFTPSGHVTLESVSSRREFFLGKSVRRIQKELNKYGYKTIIKKSKIPGSKAIIIRVLNTSKERNISQIQISPGSLRHGSVSYVKISTIDIGRIKIINSKESEYKTDGKENAVLLFRRKW